MHWTGVTIIWFHLVGKAPGGGDQAAAPGETYPANELRATTRKGAFTLVEILGVIIVIVVLAGMILGAVGHVQRQAYVQTAKAEIAGLGAALESYKLDTGVYPLSTATRSNASANSAVLYTALAGGTKKHYVFHSKQIVVTAGVTNAVDPFGNPYNYYCRRPPASNQINQVSFDLWSSGADEVSSSTTNQVDDITNWK